MCRQHYELWRAQGRDIFMKGKQAEIEGFCWNGHKLTVNRFILAIGSYWFGWFDLEAVFFFCEFDDCICCWFSGQERRGTWGSEDCYVHLGQGGRWANVQKVEGQKVPNHRRPSFNRADMTKTKGSLFRELLVFCAANWGTPKVLERFLADDHDVKSASVFLRFFLKTLAHGLSLTQAAWYWVGILVNVAVVPMAWLEVWTSGKIPSQVSKRFLLDHRQVGCSWPWGMILDGHGGEFWYSKLKGIARYCPFKSTFDMEGHCWWCWWCQLVSFELGKLTNTPIWRIFLRVFFCFYHL